ncbi:hypothetical protein Lsan_1838 [Legionella santicrucis]|uniref:Acyl-CoA dehydrogenase/oxidase C-terminal domain-containing protein n=1 Tax=Legionella santicrucis TaxID=45074 RepID=A0A0W0YX05_9GAMM|nr:acyl-CoA dehydrogenase family protein [Legionella santicrucis]KTD61461.1 hypothetical protein Lsan_1838 [Legionella santicrucis]
MSVLNNYPFLAVLKTFYAKNPLHHCLKNDKICPKLSFEFFANLAFDSEDVGACISLMVNLITLFIAQQQSNDCLSQHLNQLLNGEIITAVANNEAFHHGSNLNAMTSCIKFNSDSSFDIVINKPLITNAGAADLVIASVPIEGKAKNQFAMLLFEGSEIQQKCFSEQLSGLRSCPTGSISAQYKNIRNIRLVTEVRRSLLVMRQIYNMERFLLGCIMTGILKKILHYALKEMDDDVHEKFANQYLQNKILSIFEALIRLESLVKNCIDSMEKGNPTESILSIIKLSCINDVGKSIILLKEICGGKSYFKNHITSKLLADHEALNNLGGTRELMKQTLWQTLKNHKIRNLYV